MEVIYTAPSTRRAEPESAKTVIQEDAETRSGLSILSGDHMERNSSADPTPTSRIASDVIVTGGGTNPRPDDIPS